MYDDLEDILNRRQCEVDKSNSKNKELKKIAKKPLRANKGASLFDFIKMVDKMVTLTMEDFNVKFVPDEGKVPNLANDEELDQPMITYKVIHRKTKNELKPRYREDFIDTSNGEDIVGDIYGQKFKCHIQFNFFASVYEIAEQVMEKFEEMMVTYAGYFKRNGVAEILFDDQFTDSHFDSMRQTLSIRSLCYYVEIEKMTVIMKGNIKDIDVFQ